MILCDPAAERAVLSGICKYGENAYLDIADILQPSTFTVDSNVMIFSVLKEICEKEHSPSIDIASILSASQSLNFSHILSQKNEAQHLKAIIDFPVNLENVRKFAAKIRKLQIARLLRDQLETAKDKLLEINGQEPISSIIGIAEDSVFNFSSLLNDTDNNPVSVSSIIDDYINNIKENPIDQIGVPTGFHVYDNAIGGGLRKGSVSIIAARPKAQPLTAKILTPNGWKTMGDIKIGDILVDPSTHNGTTKVIGIYPFGNKEVFEFTFSDGSKTMACSDHLWKTKTRKDKTYQIISLKDMLNRYPDLLYNNGNGYMRARWQFPLTKPVRFTNRKNYYIDPYVLGCLLGDGCCTQNSIMFSTNDQEIIDNINSRLKDNFKFKKKNGDNYDWILNTNRKINSFRKELVKLKLFGKNSYTKFIPKSYKYSSVQTRISILQGLFDTDGSISHGYGIDYTTASKRLAKDIKEIVLSLGGLCSISNKYILYNSEKKKYYRLYVTFNNISKYFKLSRKKQKCKIRSKEKLQRSLISVKSIGVEPVQCIRVDSTEQLYVTDNYIVTKNTGKTLLADNIGLHIAKNVKLPVLNMDTEMSTEDHINRLLAMMTEIEINTIETGKAFESPDKQNRLQKAQNDLKDIRLYYKSIAGKPFEEQLAIMRRWLVKEVGLHPDGTAKDCVIVYDYLKLMDSAGISQDMKEYQLLGFMMTSLHNFAVRYKVPILGFIQLNRDGITKESTDTASGSDRIIWLCSNFTIFKRKSDEEIAEDGPNNGNRKLVPLISRHGGGLDDNDYINCHMKGWCAKIEEGKTRLELVSNNKDSDKGFILNDEHGNEEEIPFV